MKSVKFVKACVVTMLLFTFVAACGGQDINLDLLRANVQLQEEVERLRHDFQHLMEEHSNLYAELRYVQDQVSAKGMANQFVNGEYHGEFFEFYFGYQGLLAESYLADFSFEHASWQNLGTSSAGMEYILWRGSWVNLANTEANLNLLVQQGWELVTMFHAVQGVGGPAGGVTGGGIVVVMRR